MIDNLFALKNYKINENFVPLEKKNEDNYLIDFYRNIKEKLVTNINISDLNRETFRENQLKKYK